MRSTRLSVLMSVGVAVLVAGSLTACAPSSYQPDPTPTSKATVASQPTRSTVFEQNMVELPSRSPSASTEPTAPAEPTEPAEVLFADHLVFSCGFSDYETMEEAWENFDDEYSVGTRGCLVMLEDDAPGEEISDYTLTDLEKKLVETDSFTGEPTSSGELSDLEDLYYSCAQKNMYNGYSSPDWEKSHIQNQFQLVKQLCPNHPNIEELTAKAEAGAATLAETEAGVRFEDGTYLVGDEIQPGTYVTTTPGGGCYWERTDSTGEIIDNNFMTSARRAEVTIGANDYSFHSDRCGEWTAL